MGPEHNACGFHTSHLLSTPHHREETTNNHSCTHGSFGLLCVLHSVTPQCHSVYWQFDKVILVSQLPESTGTMGVARG